MAITGKLEGALQRHFKKNASKGLLYRTAHNSYYLPVEFTKGRAAIFHGYTGHSDQPSVQHLVQVLRRKMHFTAFTLDFPYHGLSNDPEKPSDLGKITSFRRWVHAVRVGTYQVLKLRSEKNPGVFLIGESAGALAIIRFLQVNPEIQKYLAGVVILSVPLEVDQNASKWIQRNIKLLEPILNLVACVFPNFPVGDLPEGSKEDSLEYHGRIRARAAMELRNAALEARARQALERIEVPILFIHSDSDGIALPEQVRVAYRSVATPSDKKEFIVYQGAPHRVLHQAVGDIQEWIEKRNLMKDWKPFQEEGVLNETVKFSSLWWRAIHGTLMFVPRIVLSVRKSIVAAYKKMIKK